MGLSHTQFGKIKSLLYDVCGIDLQPGKEGLVDARLAKRLRELKLGDYDQYLSHILEDPSRRELSWMVDALTTNKTDFFREKRHFDFLHQTVLPKLVQEKRPLRFWSAACSSGEEPYSLAMQLQESLKQVSRFDVRILATDISSEILAKAKSAIYPQSSLSGLPERFKQKYFTSVKQRGETLFQVGDTVRQCVSFARLNLMQPWPMKGPFDVIFCRNVMIYFDTQTRAQLVSRFYELLRPGGFLLIGHSESLTGIAGAFRYVQPATYVK